MTASILALLCALAPVAAALVMRRIKHNDDPEQQRQQRQSEIDRAIVARDGGAVNRLLADNLARLQNPNHSAQR